MLQQAPPIIVRIIEPKPKGLGDVLLEALGLTGIIAVIAVVLAAGLAAFLVWLRSRA